MALTDRRYDLLAHITGAPGAGKTTLLNELARLYPQLVVKDTDDFDDEAAARMGYTSNEIWDLSTTDRNRHQRIRKEIADAWLEAHAGMPIVMCGYYWTRPEHPPAPTTLYRVRLNTGPLKSAWRAWRRERRKGFFQDGLHDWLGRTYRQIARLDALGYAPRSKTEILSDLPDMIRLWHWYEWA